MPVSYAMAQEVLSNTGASQSRLATTQGRPKFAHISRAERMRVQSLMLSTRGASVHDLGLLASKIMESKFAPVDRDALLDTLGEISSSLPHHSGPLPARAGLQNFEAIANYCPEALWAEMKDGTVEGLVDFALSLGLWNPSEPAQLSGILPWL